jgi:hypothetical protein
LSKSIVCSPENVRSSESPEACQFTGCASLHTREVVGGDGDGALGKRAERSEGQSERQDSGVFHLQSLPYCAAIFSTSGSIQAFSRSFLSSGSLPSQSQYGENDISHEPPRFCRIYTDDSWRVRIKNVILIKKTQYKLQVGRLRGRHDSVIF